MSYQSKLKVQKIVMSIISYTCFMFLGGFVGFFAVNLEKEMGLEINGLNTFVVILVCLIIVFLWYYISLCLHEIGHLIFGLISGYTFSSIRFGSLMISKENGKIQFSRFILPGTGGQCIMEPPKRNPEEMPVFLYNTGGLFVNLFLSIISGLIAYYTSGLVFLMSISFSLMNTIAMILNGIPFSQIGNDGANTIILCRNKKARAAFYNTLKVVELTSKEVNLRDMPKELFEYNKEDTLDNPIITSQAVNYFNYLLNTEQYQQAMEMADYILDNASSINQIHETLLQAERMYISAVINRDMDMAESIYKKNKKSFKVFSKFISIQRCLYAYYSLVNIDEKKRDQYKKQFLKTVKTYPYKVDAQNEQRLFDLVEYVQHDEKKL